MEIEAKKVKVHEGGAGLVRRRMDCVKCGLRHVDKGEWATRPHKTHRCENCGSEWRPFNYATVGVLSAKEELTIISTGDGSCEGWHGNIHVLSDGKRFCPDCGAEWYLGIRLEDLGR